MASFSLTPSAELGVRWSNFENWSVSRLRRQNNPITFWGVSTLYLWPSCPGNSSFSRRSTVFGPMPGIRPACSFLLESGDLMKFLNTSVSGVVRPDDGGGVVGGGVVAMFGAVRTHTR
eukprot:scaffold27_cov125-Isochrysis_galbana.AAC.7